MTDQSPPQEQWAGRLARMSDQEFYDSGLMTLINALVLWPRGLALAIETPDDEPTTVLRLHGFGIKTRGLIGVHDVLHSADSMAWSFTARRQQIRLPGHAHKTCANCLPFAEQWHASVLAGLLHQRPRQLALIDNYKESVVL